MTTTNNPITKELTKQSSWPSFEAGNSTDLCEENSKLRQALDELRNENEFLHSLLDRRSEKIQRVEIALQERDATIRYLEDYVDNELDDQVVTKASDPASKRQVKKVTTGDFAKTKKQAERDAKNALKAAEKAKAKAEREAKKAKKEAERVELKAKKDAEKALKKAEREAKMTIEAAEKAQKKAEKQVAKEAKIAAEKAQRQAKKEEKKAQRQAKKEAEKAQKGPAKRATPPMAIWQRENKDAISAQVKTDTSGDKYMVIVGRIWKTLGEDVQLRYKELSKAEKQTLDAAAAPPATDWTCM